VHFVLKSTCNILYGLVTNQQGSPILTVDLESFNLLRNESNHIDCVLLFFRISFYSPNYAQRLSLSVTIDFSCKA
jgi:hypothetical protein